MLDQIRQDIQHRLDELMSEADRLRQALTALGGEDGAGAARTASAASPGATRSRSRASSRGRSGSASSSRTRSTNGASASRASAGGTKNAVLKALSDADGQALTATEVASATGLGRASVSTTLSKLARAGDVTKAARGYQLASGADENGDAETGTEA